MLVGLPPNPAPTIRTSCQLRWGRPKDLDDARDVLAVQGIDSLNLEQIRTWCHRLSRDAALETVIAAVKRVIEEP
jgi:hypothetical protein